MEDVNPEVSIAAVNEAFFHIVLCIFPFHAVVAKYIKVIW